MLRRGGFVDFMPRRTSGRAPVQVRLNPEELAKLAHLKRENKASSMGAAVEPVLVAVLDAIERGNGGATLMTMPRKNTVPRNLWLSRATLDRLEAISRVLSTKKPNLVRVALTRLLTVCQPASR